jgi:hypothetical protein
MVFSCWVMGSETYVNVILHRKYFHVLRSEFTWNFSFYENFQGNGLGTKVIIYLSSRYGTPSGVGMRVNTCMMLEKV